MKWLFKISLSALLIIISISCSRSRSIDALLRQADDSVMVNAAYTAALLDTLSIDRLTSDSQRALYALLFTQAHTRLHDSIPSDSLICFATEYYANHGPQRRLMLSLFYLGQTRLEHDQYNQALVPLLRSYEIAEDLSEYHWIGMAARALGDLYYYTYNRKEELEMSRKASEAFKCEGDSLFFIYAELDRACALANSFKYTEALALSDTLLSYAEQFDDENYLAQVLSLKGMANIGKYQWAEAVENYEAFIGSEYFTQLDSIRLSQAALLGGNRERGIEIYRKLDIPDDIYGWELRYKYYKIFGKWDSALVAYEKVDSFMKHFVDMILTRNIAGELQLYQQRSSDELNSHLNRSKSRLLSVVIGVIISGIVIALIVFYMVRRYRAELRYQMDNTDTLIKEANNQLDMVHGQMNSMMQDYYSFLNSLIIAATDNDDNWSDKRQLSNIRKAIDDLVSSKDSFNELILQLNIQTNNLVGRFQDALPNIPEKDVRLFVFSLLKFSNESLTVLLQEKNIRSVYDRKRRLKDRIKNLPEPDRNEFLAVL